jgi:heat shock protein HslJ
MKVPAILKVATVLALTTCATPGCSSHKPHTEPPSSSQQASAHIEDVTWQLASVGGKRAQPALPGETGANFHLSSPDKQVSGFTGVNQFSGAYQLQGQSLKFNPLAMTRRAAINQELSHQEDALARAFGATASWRATSKDHIDLLDSSGKTLASFVAQGTN